MSRHSDMVNALRASILDLDTGAGSDLTYAEQWGADMVMVHGNLDVSQLASIALHVAEEAYGNANAAVHSE